MELQRGTAADRGFYDEAAKALIQPGGMDAAMILLRDDAGWNIAGSHVAAPHQDISFRADLVDEACRLQKVLYHTPGFELPEGGSIAVAPMVNQQGDSFGAVYCARGRTQTNQRRGIRPVEAWFARVVAETVAAAVARSQREAELAERESFLSHVFPAQVVQRLRSDPQILEGRESIVTTMFVDLRGFTALGNRLPARTTWELVTDLMDCWTELVIRHNGAIVDYFGDGLAAFWNAPLEIENHASLAVVCAHRIRDSLPQLNRRWESVTGSPLLTGIGIATGRVQVGNCGSRHRVKYGPHGRSVNLARRLESLTTHTGIPLLVSAETANQIGPDFLSRRLFYAEVKGFAEPVPVWQPLDSDVADPLAAISRYESALARAEAGETDLAARELESLLRDTPRDDAARFLLQQLNRAPSRLRSITWF